MNEHKDMDIAYEWT